MPRPHSHGRGGPRICCRASRKKSADLVEVKRPNDQPERYLSIEELRRLEAALDTKMYRQSHQPDVLSAPATRSDRPDDGYADVRDIRSDVERCSLSGGPDRRPL